MILIVDIGNTNTVVGVAGEGKVLKAWRLETRRAKTRDEYRVTIQDFLMHAGLKTKDLQAGIMASVVPELDQAFCQLMEDLTGASPLMVGPGIKTGMPIRLDNPREVGADRIANGIAAYDICKKACLVIDFGTAITYDVVSKEGAYLGGAICPGPRMSADSLGRETSKLMVVDICRPERVIGTSTQTSVKSGLFYGFLAQIEGMVERISQELGGRPQVLATGGLASLFSAHTAAIDLLVPDLTLQGLVTIYQRNQA